MEYLVNFCKLSRIFQVEYIDGYDRMDISMFGVPQYAPRPNWQYLRLWLNPGERYRLPEGCTLQNVRILDGASFKPLPREWELIAYDHYNFEGRSRLYSIRDEYCWLRH